MVGIICINTTLGNVSGTISRIYNNTAFIKTSFGNVTASVSSIKEEVRIGETESKDPVSPLYIIMIAMLGVYDFLDFPVRDKCKEHP
ncbi:MAG: hypothetical protein QXO03_00515 [Thermoplasmatales archaeon]